MSNVKKIAIIGAGFSGLAAAWDFVTQGYQVTVFEAANKPGGLASGFKAQNWKWSVEKHYHHIFETDKDILAILDEMGLEDLVFFRDTKSYVQYEESKYQLDSPISLLLFSPISFLSRIRTGVVLAFLKIFPFGQLLERFTAQEFLQRTMGKESWSIIWEPLFLGKFGDHAAEINAAWFWARIYARSKKLGYFTGGFLELANAMVQVLTKKGVIFHFNTPIANIQKKSNRTIFISAKSRKKIQSIFDIVIVAAPSGVLAKVVPDLPQQYREQISQLKGLAAATLVLELKKPFFHDHTYWLNINETEWPFLAVVEHTNFAEKENYGGKHLLYVGKYLEQDSSQFLMNEQELLKLYTPYLKKISNFSIKDVAHQWLFKESFAQPIVEKYHSQLLPSMKTPIENVFWISMQHVYPWDRGVNYAVRVGRELVRFVENENQDESNT